jgi:hypothetical protein
MYYEKRYFQISCCKGKGFSAGAQLFFPFFEWVVATGGRKGDIVGAGRSKLSPDEHCSQQILRLFVCICILAGKHAELVLEA